MRWLSFYDFNSILYPYYIHSGAQALILNHVTNATLGNSAKPKKTPYNANLVRWGEIQYIYQNIGLANTTLGTSHALRHQGTTGLLYIHFVQIKLCDSVLPSLLVIKEWASYVATIVYTAYSYATSTEVVMLFKSIHWYVGSSMHPSV